MDDDQNQPVREPVEDNIPVEGTHDEPEASLQDPLQTPELPSQTMTNEELDAILPTSPDSTTDK
jgi:hypothetical protein